MKYILVGGGLHSQSILSLNFNDKIKNNIIGYLDNSNKRIKLDYLGNDNDFILKNKKKSKQIRLIMGIGIDTNLRGKIFKKFNQEKFTFQTIIDSSSQVSANCFVDEGCVIFKNSVISNNVRLGKNLVLHSGVIVEHNCQIEDHCYLGPGVTICGNSKIGKCSLLGANSCILENLTVANQTKIGASACVIKSISKPGCTYVGVPAKKKNE